MAAQELAVKAAVVWDVGAMGMAMVAVEVAMVTQKVAEGAAVAG